MVGPRVAAPTKGPPGIKNDLLPGARAYNASFDIVNLIGTTLCCGRDRGEFDGRPGNAVPGTTTTQEHAQKEEKSPFSRKTL
jgi:hypothetical protein